MNQVTQSIIITSSSPWCAAIRSRLGRANHVPTSTAYRWARSPEVCRAVDAARRRVIDQAASILAGHADWAFDQIAKIAREADSESVRLAAYRTILSHSPGFSRSMKLNDVARSPNSTPLGEADGHAARHAPRPSRIRKGRLERRLARVEAAVRGRAGSAGMNSELPTAGNRTKSKQRVTHRGVISSLPLVSEGSRPTCAQVENRDSGDMENR